MRHQSALTTRQGTRSEQALPLNNLKHFKDMYSPTDKIANKIRNHELLNN